MKKIQMDDATLLGLWTMASRAGMSQSALAKSLQVKGGDLHTAISNAQQRQIRNAARAFIQPSPYPVYDAPLEMEGDALIIPDPEFPFHDADFLNKVLNLAAAWGIRKAIIAGDVLHFNSITSWGAAWTLPGGEISLASESDVARRELLKLGELFTEIHYVLGNHDGRFLAALNSPLMADDLLRFVGLDNPTWKIAPFYYSYLTSGGRRFRIEHPKSAAENTASRLASKYLCSVLMGHSHLWDFKMDVSGQFYAVHMGHTCDERRMPYASQRSNSSPAHCLGAVIVRAGYPWLLSVNTPWDELARLR